MSVLLGTTKVSDVKPVKKRNYKQVAGAGFAGGWCLSMLRLQFTPSCREVQPWLSDLIPPLESYPEDPAEAVIIPDPL